VNNLRSILLVFPISILASLECTLSKWCFEPFELLNDLRQFLKRHGFICRSLNGCDLSSKARSKYLKKRVKLTIDIFATEDVHWGIVKPNDIKVLVLQS